jgi:hypothetical protein
VIADLVLTPAVVEVEGAGEGEGVLPLVAAAVEDMLLSVCECAERTRGVLQGVDHRVRREEGARAGSKEIERKVRIACWNRVRLRARTDESVNWSECAVSGDFLRSGKEAKVGGGCGGQGQSLASERKRQPKRELDSAARQARQHLKLFSISRDPKDRTDEGRTDKSPQRIGNGFVQTKEG